MNKKFSNEVLNAFAAKVFADLLVICGTAVVVFFVTSSTAKRFSAVEGNIWAIGFCGFVLLACLWLWLRHRFDRLQPRFPRVAAEFRILERRISYTFHSATTATYRRAYKLLALKSGLDRYVDRYRWTGDGVPHPESRNPDHKVKLAERKNLWQCFETIFHRQLSKKEEIEIDVEWNLDDPSGKAVPFFSVTIEEPTDLLIMELCLPLDIKITRVVCEHASHIGARHAYKSEDKTLDRDGKVVWTVERPQLLHYYEMRWGNRNS